MRSISKIVLVNAGVLVTLLLVLEIVFRLLGYSPVSHKSFRQDRPEPYANSSYFSPKFLKESFEQPGGWHMPEGTNLILPNNYSGKFFNIRDNIRVTTGTQAEAKRTIYLLGGSTIYNSEVPDDFTIASQLQKRLNTRGVGANVVNLGVTSVYSDQQLERLQRDVELAAGDIVIFYDGVNDVNQRLLYANQKGAIAQGSRIAPFLTKQIRRLAKYSALFRFLDETYFSAVKTHYPDEEVNKAVTDYLAVLETANQWVEERGGRFHHFLQPTIYTKKELNAYEAELFEIGAPVIHEGVGIAFRAAYPVIREALSDVPYSNDLTAAFDGLPHSPYLDFCHITDVGNEVIAEKLFARISDDLGK